MRRRSTARSRRSVRRSSGAGAAGAGRTARRRRLRRCVSRGHRWVLVGCGPASRAASGFRVGAHGRHRSSGGLRPRSNPAYTRRPMSTVTTRHAVHASHPDGAPCPRCSASGSSCWTARWARCSSATGSARPTSAASASPTTRSDVRGNTDLLCLTQPGRRPRRPRGVPRRGRRHRQHQLVHRDPDRAGRLRPVRTSRGEINEAAARLAREAADDAEAADGRPRYVGGSLGPDQPHRLDLAGRQRPRGPQRHLRGAAAALPRGGRGPGRGRRRPPAGRDGLRHPQRQGRDLRDRGGVRGPRPADPGRDLRDDRRRLGPDAVGADAGGVLDEHPARGPAARRPQLRARPRSSSASMSRSSAGWRTCRSPPTRTPACPTSSAATTRRPTRRPRRWASGRAPACSTSPARAAAPRPSTPRRSPRPSPASRRASSRAAPTPTRLAGLEPLVIPMPGGAFVNIGERTNVTGSRKFARLMAGLDGDGPPTARRRRPRTTRSRSPATRSPTAP